MALLLPVENNSNPPVTNAKLFIIWPQSVLTTSSPTTLPVSCPHFVFACIWLFAWNMLLCMSSPKLSSKDLPDSPNPYQKLKWPSTVFLYCSEYTISLPLYHWLIRLYSDRGEFHVRRASSHSPFLFSLVHTEDVLFSIKLLLFSNKITEEGTNKYK